MSIVVLVALLLFSCSLQAQKQVKSTVDVQLGYTLLGNQTLGEELEREGWPNAGSSHAGLGLSLRVNRGISSRIFTVGAIRGSFLWRQADDSSSVNRTNYAIEGGLGFALFNYDYQLAILSLKVGSAGNWLRLDNFTDETRYFGSEPIGANYWQGFLSENIYLDVGLHWMQIISLGDDLNGMTFGLNLGYRFSVTRSPWTNPISEDVARGVAPNPLRGAYFKLCLGKAWLEEELEQSLNY